MDVKLNFLCILCGAILGFIFTFLKLPLPAPNVLPGIMGIIGVYLGFVICNFIIN